MIHRGMRMMTLVSLWKNLVGFSLLSYSVLTTVLLIKLKPEPLLIGVDPYGTRIIRTTDDRLIRQEKENFLKKVIQILNNYDSETFKQKISEVGDFMSKELWEKKRDEFHRISEGLEKESLTQRTEIEDLREVDSHTFQADLIIRIKNRLQETVVKTRVDLKLRESPRTTQNPYPYEVDSYEEQTL